MSENERLTVGAVLTTLLFLVPAFVLHSSPRFAGSLSGFVLGAAAAALMLSCWSIRSPSTAYPSDR